MNLIFIYGPPASGKLTVSKELKKLTGYKVFHNHLTLDLLESIFDFGTPYFFRLSGKLRLELIEEAAKQNIPGLIFTFCYSHPDDVRFVNQIIKKVERYNGKVCFVHLHCKKSELLKRVKHASRESFNKVKSKKKLSETLERYDFFTPIPGVNSLKIDNTKIAAKKAAARIKTHYNL
jgi:shikimate kinase